MIMVYPVYLKKIARVTIISNLVLLYVNVEVKIKVAWVQL